MPTPIEFKLRPSKSLQRYGCNICRGCTEKVDVHAIADYEGEELQVCETCLRGGIEKIRETLEKRACENEEKAKTAVEDLLKDAGEFRDVAARIQVPTYAEYEAASEEEGQKYMDHNAADALLRYITNDDGRMYRQSDLSMIDDHEFCLNALIECMIPSDKNPHPYFRDEVDRIKQLMPLIIELAKKINGKEMTREEYQTWAATRPSWIA